MRRYHPDTDPATIPDPILKSEYWRRASAARKTNAGGRPKKLATCPKCGYTDGAREMRAHRCTPPPEV